jgi:hypothetical protein
MTLEKNKEWDALETREDELVASLELELYAGDRGVPVDAWQLSDIESNDDDSSEASVPLQTYTIGMPESDNTDAELDT